MSNQETRASTGRYAPSVSYNQQAPQPINQRLQSKVDVKSPDWVSTSIQAIESFGKIYGKVKETEAAAQAEAALNTAKNDLARQANMIAEEQRQTGMSAATAASRYRMLADNALAGGTLTEKDIADVIGRYDGGILNIDQSRQQKIMEDDQKYWENQSQEIADKNPALSRMQPSDRTKLLMEMRTLTDDVNKYRGWMSSLPEGDEKESAKAYYNQLMGSNIKVNMAVQLGNMFAQSKVVNEEDWVALRSQAIQACLDNGMDRATAGVLVDEVANSYSVTGDLTDIKRYFKDNTNYLESANKMILANAENKVVSLPGLALLQAMPQELQKSMLNQNWPTYQLLTRPFLANVGTDSNGKKYLEGLDRISPNFVAPLAQAVNNMNSSGMYNDFVRGKTTGIALSAVNSVNQLSLTSSVSDANVVALNSDGTRQYINFNLSRKQADALLRSTDPEEVATGEFLTQQLDVAEEQQWLANNIPTADTIVKTLTNLNGGDEEAYRANNSLKNSTNAASLRFNDNGELFISDADRSTLAELGYAFDKLPLVGGEYEEELATINNKLSTLEPEMRKLVLTRAGYKQAAAGELPLATVEKMEKVATEGNQERMKVIDSTLAKLKGKELSEDDQEFVSVLKNLRKASWKYDREEIVDAFRALKNTSTWNQLSTQAQQAIAQGFSTGISNKEMAEIDAAIEAGNIIEGKQPMTDDEAALHSALNRDLKPNIRRAVEGALQATATTRSSETLANAGGVITPDEMIEDYLRNNYKGVSLAGGIKEWGSISKRIDNLIKENKDLFGDTHPDNFKLEAAEIYKDSPSKAFRYIGGIEDSVEQLKKSGRKVKIDEKGNVKYLSSASTKSSTTLASAKVMTDPYEDRGAVEGLNQEAKARQHYITWGRAIKNAVRKAEPDSEEFNNLMSILEEINSELVELGEDPYDPYGE